MTNAWDQQPNESSKAFERFALYRGMGAGRSLRKLAKDLERNPSTVAEISKRHDWQERVTAFDAYIDRASQHNQIIQTKAMKRRQIVLALRAQKLAEKGLKKLMRDIDDDAFLRLLRPEGFLNYWIPAASLSVSTVMSPNKSSRWCNSKTSIALRLKNWKRCALFTPKPKVRHEYAQYVHQYRSCCDPKGWA